MNSCNITKESKNYHQYLLNIYSMEYMIEIAKMTSAINDIKRFSNVDGLDIDVDSYINELDTIRKEVNKLEKSGNITIDIYKSYKNRIKELLDKINEEFNSLTIVGFYLKRINDLLNDKDASIEEVEDVIGRLNDYVTWIRMIDEKEYQNICEKYGVIENKALIGLIVISKENNIKSKR